MFAWIITGVKKLQHQILFLLTKLAGSTFKKSTVPMQDHADQTKIFMPFKPSSL